MTRTVIMSETNDSVVDTQETSTGEGGEATETKEASQDLSQVLAKLEEFGADIASLKRTAKKTVKETKTETPEKTEQSDNGLIEKTFLRAAQITDQEEVELALTTAKKWDMPIDKLVDDADFQAKLEKHRTAKANAEATSNVKGDKTGTSQKDTPEYWIAKGVPPTRDQVPDRKTRVAITQAMAKDAKGGGKFYND